jgi:hypothetical protein
LAGYASLSSGSGVLVAKRITMKDELITIRHYAELKGLTVAAIYKQIKLGKLEAIKIDGIMFIKTKK